MITEKDIEKGEFIKLFFDSLDVTLEMMSTFISDASNWHERDDLPFNFIKPNEKEMQAINKAHEDFENVSDVLKMIKHRFIETVASGVTK